MAVHFRARLNLRSVGLKIALIMVAQTSITGITSSDVRSVVMPAMAGNTRPPIGNPDHASSYSPAMRPRVSSEVDSMRMMYPSPTCVECEIAKAHASATAISNRLDRANATVAAAIAKTAAIIIQPIRLGAPKTPIESDPMNAPMPTALNRVDIPVADALTTFCPNGVSRYVKPPSASAVTAVNVIVPKIRGSLISIFGICVISAISAPWLCAVASGAGLNCVTTTRFAPNRAATTKYGTV